MSKLKEVNRQGTFAWSPIVGQSMMAVGTAAGTIGLDFDTSSKLEVYSLDITNPSPQMTLRGTASSANRFNKIIWTPTGGEQGLIVGGMENGSIGVWNPNQLIADAGDASMTFTEQKHSGAVQAMDFNVATRSVATGGPNSEVYIWNLENPTTPFVFPKPSQVSDVTSLAYNNKVQHIIGNSSINGIISIWDTRANRSVMQFSDPTGVRKTRSFVWNPTDSLQLLTACEDDNHPVIHNWDLRSTKTGPSGSLSGHRAGVWGLSWCPNDLSLLLSCGKDNRTLCWNVSTRQVLCEIETSADPNHWNYDVQWSPVAPAMLATSSFGGSIQAYSLQDVNARNVAPAVNSLGVVSQPAATPDLRHPPNWLMRPVGASFGFGGRLAIFGRSAPISSPPQPGAPLGTQAKQSMVEQQRVVRISKVVSDTELLERSDRLESVMQNGRFEEFCDQKIASSKSDEEKSIWGFLKVSFDQNGKKNILNYLGFDVESTKVELARFLQTLPSTNSLENDVADLNIAAEQNGTSEHAEKEISFDNLAEHHDAQEESRKKLIVKPISFPSEGDENMITKALLIGDYATAVDCCLRLDRMADALVLASCGGQDLWKRTMRAYFEANADKSFARVVACIARDDLATLVESSQLSDWKSTLSVLCTYASAATFKQLSGQLGDRLSAANDSRSATLCYICAGDIDKTVDIWTTAHAPSTSHDLLNLIEKVSILRSSHHAQALRPSESLAQKYARYAEMLASQGNLGSSLRYLSLLNNQDPDSLVLVDRVYRSAPNTQGIAPPPFPFQPIEVYPAGGRPVIQQQPQPVRNTHQPIQNTVSATQQHQHTSAPPPVVHYQAPPVSTTTSSFAQQHQHTSAPPPVVHYQAPPQPNVINHMTHQHSSVPPPITSSYAPSNPTGMMTGAGSVPPPMGQSSFGHSHPVATAPPVMTSPFNPSPPAPVSFVASNPVAPPIMQASTVPPPMGQNTANASTPTNLSPTNPYQSQPVGPPPMSPVVPRPSTVSSPSSSGLSTPPPRANVHNPIHSHIVGTNNNSASASPETKQEVARIIDSLTNTIASLKSRGLNPQHLDDASKRIQDLFNKLNEFTVSDHAIQALAGVTKAIAENDHKLASKQYLDITSSPLYNEIGAKKMVGLKVIINLLK